MDMKNYQRLSLLHQPLAKKELSIILIRLLLVCILLLFSYIIGYFLVGDISFNNAMVVRAFCISVVKFFVPFAFPCVEYSFILFIELTFG